MLSNVSTMKTFVVQSVYEVDVCVTWPYPSNERSGEVRLKSMEECIDSSAINQLQLVEL